ncbi:hypothetical protein HWV62_44993 [Athelia sp. TMB]|nr:hypothetical protein HWV62_44993 [Athelia sp. TMB]
MLLVITSLFYPALALYSSSAQSFNSFLGPSAVSGFYSQQDLRNIWEGHPVLRVVEDAVSRAKCGKQRTLRLERVLIQNSFAENSDHSALNYQILKSTLDFEQHIANQVNAHGCLKGIDGHCFVISPLAFWDQTLSPSDLTRDTNILETLSLSRNTTVSGIPITPHMVLAGRGSFGYEQADQYDYADFLALTFFFPDSDCLGNAEHEAWLEFIQGAASSTAEPTRKHAPTLIALEYDTSHTLPSHFSPISLFLYLAYFVFFVYVGLSMRGMVAVHSRIGLTFTALVEIAVSTITSLSVCALVGFRVTMVPWELLPILIVFVGAENMFSLVNAVTQTSVTLPVKERIAVGLSHAGTSNTLKVVTYNALLGTLAIFANRNGAGAITQFCVFAIVVLVAHWFLAHTFFLAVLSIDIQRLELSELLRQDPSLAPAPVAHTSKRPDSGEDLSSLSKWKKLLGSKRGFLQRRFKKDFSLVLLLAIIAALYYVTSPKASPAESDSQVSTSRGALSKGIPSMPLEQDRQSAAWRIWKTLNPDEDSLLHLRIEMPTVLTFGPNSTPGHNAQQLVELDHSRPKLYRLRSVRRAIWFAKIVILPIAATTTALYFLCLYLLKDAELLEAQRNRAEPASANVVDEMPLQGRVLFTTMPRAFPTDVEFLMASKDGTIIASVGMDNELVIIWRNDHDKQSVVTADTAEILKRPASTSSAASSITALCIDERGTLCAVGTDAGIVAVWGIDNGTITLLSHFAQDSSSAGVVDLFFLPTTNLSSVLTVYEDGTVIRWTVNDMVTPMYISPHHPGQTVKSMATRVQAENRWVVGFAIDDGSVQISEVGDLSPAIVPDCILRSGSPADLVTKIAACSVDMNHSRHLIIGTVTETGVVSLWHGQTGECMYIFDDGYPGIDSLHLSPVAAEKCLACGELPPESFTVSFSAGDVVLFYRGYLANQTRRCCCAHSGQQHSPVREISFGKRSRATSMVSSVSSSPTNIRSRMATSTANNQLLPDVTSFPVSGHGIHSRRASEKDASRRTESLTIPCMSDDNDPSQPLNRWPASPVSRTSTAWSNLVVTRLANANCERGSWNVSEREIVGIHRKARMQKAKGDTTLVTSSGALSSKGLTPAALDRWELWAFDPISARMQSAPLVLLVDSHFSDAPNTGKPAEPPRLPFTRASPFFRAGSHGLIGLGNTIGVFNFSSPA